MENCNYIFYTFPYEKFNKFSFTFGTPPYKMHQISTAKNSDNQSSFVIIQRKSEQKNTILIYEFFINASFFGIKKICFCQFV
jgi:hypothetical protein